MLPHTKVEALKRLNYLSGHLEGVRRMVESDAYCVDVLKQTHAVRKAIEKLEALLLEGHLQSCVVDGIRDGRDEQVLKELMELYQVSNR
jgi:CsoR family transcriptional regulator, copper-sensing transcriptional repressor